MEKIIVNEGGIWEHKQFVIYSDFNAEKETNSCRHIKDGKLRAIVVATNEGGFNTTGVCADCIIEALKDNGIY